MPRSAETVFRSRLAVFRSLMDNSLTAENTRAALEYVRTSNMPSQHKTLLIGLLTQALRDLEVERVRSSTLDSSARPWNPDELEQLRASLTGKVANSWQHADELLMTVVTRLKRSPNDVRTKAAELGHAESVDYRVARSRESSEAIETTRTPR